ncbi:MAG TPA: hypothetical protein VGQ11_08025 [Candidatus Acidoferrales bacterium]|jgi:hypothetical protein|nr:hypothetical protein [Candidatus Acidoferrales bacterium]
MISSNIRAALLGAALALAVTSASAQVQTEKPIRLKAPKKKIEKFKGEVLSMTNVQIIVRSVENERAIRTFTYTPDVREKMQQIIDRGGYQHGDKVEIQHEPGSDVAIKIKGKPSKPL